MFALSTSASDRRRSSSTNSRLIRCPVFAGLQTVSLPTLLKSVEKHCSPEYALVIRKSLLCPGNQREASMANESATTEAATQETNASEPPAPQPSVQPPAPATPPAKKVATKKRSAKRRTAKASAKPSASTKSPAKKVSAPKPAAKKLAAKPAKKPVAKESRPKKRVAKKPTPKPVAAKKTVRRKPKRKKARRTKPIPQITNKAQAIRDTAEKLGKKFRPRDIIAALSAKGITVSSPQVSMTLKAAGYRRVRRSRKAKAAVAANANQAVSFSISGLVHTKKLADQLGGTDRLKEALNALERLM